MPSVPAGGVLSGPGLRPGAGGLERAVQGATARGSEQAEALEAAVVAHGPAVHALDQLGPEDAPARLRLLEAAQVLGGEAPAGVRHEGSGLGVERVDQVSACDDGHPFLTADHVRSPFWLLHPTGPPRADDRAILPEASRGWARTVAPFYF